MQPPSRRTKLSRVINYAPPPPALFLRPIVSFLPPAKLYQSCFLQFRLRFSLLFEQGFEYPRLFKPSLSLPLARFYRLMILLFMGRGKERKREKYFIFGIMLIHREMENNLYNCKFEYHLIMI